ncbi:MAG: hypothetical protein J7J46_08000 [Candidatus Desulfofervidus sp.]|nr:hypothetical protein [Candidatus Desulfofervidus sp.]
MQEIYFQELVEGFYPRKGNVHDAGFDLRVFRVLPASRPISTDYSTRSETYVVRPGETVKLDCACKIAVPRGVCGLVVPRSSWRRKGLVAMSVFDHGYLLPWVPFATNCNSDVITITSGERVLQVLFIPLFYGKTLNVTKLPNYLYDRGGGAGSTGK